MFSTKDGITKRAGLVFILSLLLEGPAFAQMTSGPDLRAFNATSQVRFRVWDQVRPVRVCAALLFRP
jgi:hypothetical protein